VANRTYIFTHQRTMSFVHRMFDITFVPSDQIVDYHNIRTLCDVMINEVRSDEPSATRDDEPHRPIPE
jgi:hypothetical protein